MVFTEKRINYSKESFFLTGGKMASNAIFFQAFKGGLLSTEAEKGKEEREAEKQSCSGGKPIKNIYTMIQIAFVPLHNHHT